MGKYKRGELALRILFLISAGAAIPAVFIAPNLAKVVFPALRKFARKLDSRSIVIRKSITALKSERLIRTEIKNDETVFVLTEAGRRRVLRGQIEAVKIASPKRWDRKWRLVLFDIPEEHKKAREALRFKFRELGFYSLQKSCFIYPFECRDQVDFISEFFGISQFINYIIVESFEGENELKKLFNL